MQPNRGADTGQRARGSLLQVLGVAFGVAVLVGNTIGMGILRTPGEIAARLPSVPLFMMVWVIGALYAMLGALVVAELATMRPRSGGLFPLVQHGIGPYAGFVVGWTDWISTCGSIAAVAMVISEYLVPLIPGMTAYQPAIASCVVLAFSLLQWRGIKLGDVMQQGASLFKAVALIGLALVALFVTMEPATAPVAAASPAVVPGGFALIGAIVVALQSAIYTYDGWTGPIYFGEEVRDPGRSIPRAMLIGVATVLFIYLLLNAAFLRVVPIQEMAGDPFVAGSAALRLFGPAGDTVLRVLMIISMLASVNALHLMASRVPFALSREGWLPPVLQTVNRGGTPVAAHFATTAVALLCIATNTFNSILALLAFMFVTSYALTFTAFLVTRRREPDATRPFRCPGYPVLPAIALTGSVAFMVGSIFSDFRNSAYAIALVGISWPVYRYLRSRWAVTTMP